MITVTILTKNCAKTLDPTLHSLKQFPEILVYDTGSCDQTVETAKKFPNVKVIEGPFEGFGPTHNKASSLATYDWILSIDSDEVLSPGLAEEILRLDLSPSSVYRINRHNFFNKKWIRYCGGWYPDPVIRIYNRQMTQFSEDVVHEKILHSHLRVSPLSSPLFHTPYRSIDDFLHKMQLYSTLFAEQHRGKKQVSLKTAFIHSLCAFFKSYILKKGFLGGREGFIISLYNGHTTFYKYLKLLELNKSGR